MGNINDDRTDTDPEAIFLFSQMITLPRLRKYQVYAQRYTYLSTACISRLYLWHTFVIYTSRYNTKCFQKSYGKLSVMGQP